MDATSTPPARPGHFWKAAFACALDTWSPPRAAATTPPLRFEPVDDAWLREALAATLADSPNESDHALVARAGTGGVADTLLSLLHPHFVRPPGWWRMARDPSGEAVGFVLPVLYRQPTADPFGRQRPEATIFHMGVLPAHRGRGHALGLVIEATRLAAEAGCWRLFCDTSARNVAMRRAFERAGHEALPLRERPLP